MDNEKICGTCRHNKHDTTDFYCANGNSDVFTCYTRYGDSCDEWEEKHENPEV